jgi:hypothetical protein
MKRHTGEPPTREPIARDRRISIRRRAARQRGAVGTAVALPWRPGANAGVLPSGGTAVKKHLTAGILAALTFALVVGCEPQVVTTPAGPPTRPESEKEANIKVRTPRADVDINTEGKKGDANVDVDIHRKGSRP